MTNIKIMVGDVIERLRDLPDKAVHCCVTSPPYWGLRDYGVDGQLGLEPTIQEFIGKMTDVFEEVRRVLRDDGTLWLNMGDCYAGGGRGNGSDGCKQRTNIGSIEGPGSEPGKVPDGLKPKDLVGQPWMLAFALRSAGWYLRSEIIWQKPNPMPESCRDRPTKSHEQIFLLSKCSRYFYDQEPVREPHTTPEKHRQSKAGRRCLRGQESVRPRGNLEVVDDASARYYSPGGRNLRDVWKMATQPYSEAHFATFPQELPRKCILAGTSEKGCCPECGAPVTRVVEKGPDTSDKVSGWDEGPGHHGNECREEYRGKHGATGKQAGGRRMLANLKAARAAGGNHDNPFPSPSTIGWQANCDCGTPPIPCTVLDPFGGAGTTALVAAKMGRSAILTELNPKYANMAADRIRGECGLLATVTVDEKSAEKTSAMG